MASPIRMNDGRWEANERALDHATERQRQQLVRLFSGAGVSAVALAWGHSGTISNNALAKVINYAVKSRSQVDLVDPADYLLEE